MSGDHRHASSLATTAAWHFGHLTAVEAILIAGFGGALMGFFASRFGEWLNERKRRRQFFQGLGQDIRRCQTIDLTIGENQFELLNPIAFPFIAQVAQANIRTTLIRWK